MRLNNIFQVNDWGIKKFLSLVLAIQIALWFLIGIEALGFEIPILRQLIGFIYLTFIPGFLILRVLKLHKLGSVETLVYAVGLSLAFMMFTGLFMNTFYPLFGISKPISEMPVLLTISFLVLLLCFLSYLRDKDFSDPDFIDIKEILSPQVLALCLIPFLAVFGTYLVSFYDNNLLLVSLLTLIAVIPVVVGRIPRYVYPFAVWVIAISLLFYISLPTMYIRFTDNIVEILLCRITLSNGFWDPTYPHRLYSMLGVTMLYSIYPLVCNINFNWIVKVILPLLYSFIPVGLYQVYRKQANEKIAFLSCFFFMGMYEFYTWAGLTMKTVTVGLFLTLFLLLIVDNKIKKQIKKLFLIIFALSLAVSHYGTSYIFMFCIAGSLIILLLNKNLKNAEIIRPMFFVLYVSFAISWYLYTAGGRWFNGMIKLGEHILESILTGYILPEKSYASEVLFREYSFSLSLQMLKILLALFAVFMVVGIISYLYKKDELENFNKEYVALSVTFVFVGSTVFIGHASSAATPDRIYHLISFCLAPFSILGGVFVVRAVTKLSKFLRIIKVRNPLKVLSILLIVFFLFNSGLASVVLRDFPGAPVYISKDRILKEGNPTEKEYLRWVYATDYDMDAANWFAKNRDTKLSVIFDKTSGNKLFYFNVTSKRSSEVSGSYIFFGHFNVENELFSQGGRIFSIKEIFPTLDNYSKIFSNGRCVIFISESK